MTSLCTSRVVALGLAVLGLACGDAPTAASDRSAEESFVVSVHGVDADDAGIMLRLSTAVHALEPARASLEMAWADDAAGGTTVVVVGALAEGPDLIVVRRRSAADPLRADVIELSDAEGQLSVPSSVRTTTERVDRLRDAQ